MSSILESSHAAVIGRTPQGVISSWNHGAESLYGYSASEVIGQPSTLLLPSEQQDHETEILDRTLRGERIDHYRTERLRKDGTPIEVSLSASPIRDADGAIVGISTIEHAATWRRDATGTTREAEAFFESAFHHAPIGMALVSIEPDRPGRFLRVNRALCELTGYSRQELEATAFQAITHPEDLDRDLASMAELVAGESASYQLEERLIHAGNQAIWVMVSASLVHDTAGKPLYCIRQLQNIEERKRFEGKLGHLADHDPLTGLFNRRRFVAELSHHMAYARRYGGGGAVLFVDIDDFKYVNDTLGHKVGDEVIAAVGRAMRQRLRETDVLARLGGDEFAVLLPQTNAHEAAAVASSLLAAVRNVGAPVLRGARTRLTVSIGVTDFERPGREMTADDILVQADLAMYAAKEAGRDRVTLSTSEHRAQMRGSVTWTERLRKAVEESLFVLYCQPILDLRTDTVSQYELLLRLPGDQGEPILPAAFLYTAERSGLISAIDRWVVAEGIRVIAERRDAGQDLQFEINVSGPSVSDPELPEFIEEQLSATAIDPASLILEVTESAAVANMDQAMKFAARLTEIGCGFALDDFGAGFGSFYYLKYIPFDYVKIDGEFIRSVSASGRDQLILDSIVQMSKGLGARTIAEFVGDRETVGLLRDHGVDYAQGYHLGRPRPLPEGLSS